MNVLRPIIGFSLVAVGLGLTLAAVYLIANTADKFPYMAVWGLGLLIIMMGVKSLPRKRKQCRESTLAERSPERPVEKRHEQHD
jgi:peptidoglycan/LPS O-acetylase OafA/YrhL